MKKYVAISFGFILVGYVLLVFSMLIPNELLTENAMKSAQELCYQEDYPSLYLKGAFLENFCDADYIAVAYNQRTHNPLTNALDAYNYCYNEESGANRGVRGLYVTFYDYSQKIYEHSHAWHGYRIFLRPLLVLYSVADIRWLLTSLVFILVILICIYIYKATDKFWAFLPFLFSIVYFNYQLEALSIAISINFLLMLIPCIFILYGCINGKELDYFHACMFITGLCSAYFALCDLPSMSIGFPIIMMLAFNKRNDFDKLLEAFKMTLMWFLGYAVEGIPKFIINVFFMKLEGASTVLIWYTGKRHGVGIMDRFIKVGELLEEVFDIEKVQADIFWAMIVIIFVLLVIRKKNKEIVVKDIMAYSFVSMIPILWVIVMIVAANLDWTPFIFSTMIFAIIQYLWGVLIKDRNSIIN
jgi:uncharacterized membrane protein YecN with MAPEG domain